jgi:hypothetical protein
MILELDQLEDRVAYCVIRDEANRESIIVRGRDIKAQALRSPDFRRFGPHQAMSLTGYVRVRVNDDCHLGVWLDPTRPELHDGETETIKPLAVETVNATAKKFTLLDALTNCRYLLDLCSPS